MPRQEPVQAEAIDDSAKDQDSLRLEFRLLGALLPTFRSTMRSRRNLVVENLDFRQQLVTLTGRRRPDIQPADWLFWILLRRLWSGWADTCGSRVFHADNVLGKHSNALRTTGPQNRQATTS